MAWLHVQATCLAEQIASIFLKKNAVYDTRTQALATPERAAVGFYLEFSSGSDSPNAESNHKDSGRDVSILC